VSRNSGGKKKIYPAGKETGGKRLLTLERCALKEGGLGGKKKRSLGGRGGGFFFHKNQQKEKGGAAASALKGREACSKKVWVFKKSWKGVSRRPPEGGCGPLSERAG